MALNRRAAATTSRPELLDRGSDGAFRNLLHDLFAFGAILEAARGKFADFVGLSPTQYQILIAIAQAGGKAPAGVSDIARRLHLSGAFVTIEVNKLVAAGLVVKTPHPKDRRRVQLEVAPAGRDRLARLAELQAPVNDALFQTLSADDFRAVGDIMKRLAGTGPAALALADHLQARLSDPVADDRG